MFNALLVVLVAASVVGAALMGRWILRLPVEWVVPYEEPPYELTPDEVDKFADIVKGLREGA